MTNPLDPERTRRRIGEALPGEVSVHQGALEPERLYLPPQHLRALLPRVELVVGTRGVGKTVWFEALLSRELVQYVARLDSAFGSEMAELETHAGFGVGLRPSEHPSARTLEHLLAVGSAPEDVWRAVVLNHVADAPWAASEWQARVDWVRRNPEASDQLLAAADSDAVRKGRTHVVLFDALDRLGSSWDTVRPLIGGLFRVILDLRGSRRIHGKAFVRPDMLDRLDFADASKLATNRADLTWPRTTLYSLLLYSLGNVGDPDETAWFRRQTARDEWAQVGSTHRLPPEIEGNEEVQAALVHRMTGPFMGRDHRRGRPYTWLTNNLADERDVVSPRSFLVALQEAAQQTAMRYAGHDYALHWQAIKSGVQAASQVRVREISEDLPWVAAAVEALRGLLLPAVVEDVLERWSHDQLSKVATASEGQATAEPRVGPDLRRGAAGLLEQLTQLGLIRTTRDGRLNMPEVYRVAFGLGRKGGVARVV